MQILKQAFIIIPSDIQSKPPDGSPGTSIFVPPSPWILITYEDLMTLINTNTSIISQFMSNSTILPSVGAYVSMTTKVIDAVKCAVEDVYMY